MRPNQSFFVLCLSQKRARLFSCTLHSIKEISLEKKVPAGMAETQRFLEIGKRFQVHSTSPSLEPGFVAHGQGGGREDEKLRIEEYFRQVSEGIAKILKGRREPLILAAVGYEAALFRRVNRYPHLADETAPGNPDFLKPKDLHARTVEIMRGIIRKKLLA